MKLRVVGLGLALLMGGLAGNVHAQEAEVSAAVRATLAALTAGRYQDFVAQYHPNARGFFLDGGPLMQGFDAATLQSAAEAGVKTSVTLRDLDVKVYGAVAVSVGYLEGTLTLPGGISLPGTWRYSETRIPVNGAWKIVQFHISQSADGAM